MKLQFNRQVVQIGTFQDLVRYTIVDEAGNSIFFTPQDALDIADFFQSIRSEIQEDIRTDEAASQQKPQEP